VATIAESMVTHDILADLGYSELFDLDLVLQSIRDKDHTDRADARFFSVQNQKLLLALRWAQKRLARWQGWSWMLNDEKKKEQAFGGLNEDQFVSQELRALLDEEKWELIVDQLNADVEGLKALLVEQLVVIANRVVPLRGRNWEWVERQDEAGYVLRQTERGTDPSKTRIAGQRGLSIERIEQIEDFRKRCQSLNKALQHVPGTRPTMGYRATGQEAADPCPDILEKLDHIREQRVNQTAHLILAEGFGGSTETAFKNENGTFG
jgi:hypothetical protein